MARRQRLEGIDVVRYRRPPEIPGFAGQVLETVNALWWTTLEVMRLRARGPIQVLHAANPPDTFFLVALLLRPFGTRFVFDQHDACPELLRSQAGSSPLRQRLLRLLERASYRTASAVIVPNESYRRLAIERGRVSAERVHVVRSGPDRVVDVRRARRHPAAPVTVAFAGVMGVQDSVDVLLEAVAELHARRPGAVRLELIGDGSDVPRLRTAAGVLGIDGITEWAGWLTGREVEERLSGADMAVSPDRDDPFTRISTMTKVGEYLALGLPSVVADLPENRATAGDAALYFVAGDPTDLAKRLEELLDDRELRDELAARALVRARGLIWAHSVPKLVEAYRWACHEPSAMPEARRRPAMAQRRSP
jgi:glycosyltransferase involved in cell wall biosynthesis